MTEPGYVQPASPGWWERVHRIGIADSFVDIASSASGEKPVIRYRPPRRPPTSRVGPTALRTRPTPVAFRRDRGSVTFVAAGIGISSSTDSTVNWTDTVPAACNFAVVWITHFPGTATPGTTATIGGVSMTEVSGSPWIYSTNGGERRILHCFTLSNPPTGSKSVVLAKVSGGSGFASDAIYYQNVYSVGTLVTASGLSSTQPSMTVSDTKSTILYSQAFTYHNAGSNTFTGGTYNQTQRFLVSGGSYTEPLLIGDAYGNSGTLTFSATRTNTGQQWGGAALPLIAS